MLLFRGDGQQPVCTASVCVISSVLRESPGFTRGYSHSTPPGVVTCGFVVVALSVLPGDGRNPSLPRVFLVASVQPPRSVTGFAP